MPGTDWVNLSGVPIAQAGSAGTVADVFFVLYMFLWIGFVVGSLGLGVLLAVAAIRLLFGWRPRPTLDRPTLIGIMGIAGASLFGFVFGAAVWFGYPPEDAHLRAPTAWPPLVFGVLAMATAVSIAVAGMVARRNGESGLPEQLHPT